MESVTVKKDELLAVVKKNLEAHEDLFVRALDGYRKQVIEELDRMLKDAKDGKYICRAISLPEPIDHTNDYERVVTMLEMSTEDEIELDEQDFDRYVMDNWSWKHMATEINTSYLAQGL